MLVDNRLLDYVKKNLDNFCSDIVRLVSQPSVSARNEGIEECASLLEEMMKEIGIKAKVLRLQGAAPLVYGEITSSKSSKTIMFYNHYDVQPEDPKELWQTDPFKGTIKDGRIYGRGVADDKGELISRLKVVQTYLDLYGEVPCNFKFCFEGEEEIGSMHLKSYVDENPDLFRSDALFWEFGEIDLAGRPHISLGMKGIIYLELRIKELDHDVHSSAAAVLPSAAWKLVRLLNIIKDENERILVPGWYDNIRNLTEEEEKLIEEQEFDHENYLKALGAKSFLHGMTPNLAKKALALRPTANIAGILSGYTGAGSKTVLPHEALCKIDFRIVPDQDPEDLLNKLKVYLAEKGFGDVEVKVESFERAARTNFNEKIVSSASLAAEKIFKIKPTIHLSSPGTGPLYVFTDKYNVPAVSMGISSTDSMIHAPNENIRIENLEKGIVWFCETIDEFLKS